MTSPGITGTFGNHDFLKGLSERHLLILASGARPFTNAPGSLLAREGETARYFYLIQSGTVEISILDAKQGNIEIQKVGPGEVLGWSWLVPPHRWQFDCRAKDQVQGIQFDAEWLRDKCAQDHELGYHLLKQLLQVVASRLASTRLRMYIGKR